MGRHIGAVPGRKKQHRVLIEIGSPNQFRSRTEKLAGPTIVDIHMQPNIAALTLIPVESEFRAPTARRQRRLLAKRRSKRCAVRKLNIAALSKTPSKEFFKLLPPATILAQARRWLEFMGMPHRTN